jgi:hypothetical protein
MDQMPGQFPPPPDNGSMPDNGSPPGYSPVPGSHFPLDANGLFSLTFSLYRFRRRTLAAIALAILIPAVLVQVAVEFVTADSFTALALEMQVMARGGTPQIPADLLPLVGLSLLASAFYGIASYAAQAAITKAALDTYSGRQPQASGSIRYGLGKLVTLTAFYLVAIAASFAVIFFALILASFAFLAGPLGLFLGLVIIVSAVATLLFLSVRWSLVVPVVVFEDRGALGALGRSWRLVSGSSWRVLGYVVAFALLLFVIGLAIAFVVGLLLTVVLVAARSSIDIQTLSPIVSLAGALLIALLVPIPAIGMMLLYLDLRHRQGEVVPQPGRASEPDPLPPGPPTF